MTLVIRTREYTRIVIRLRAQPSRLAESPLLTGWLPTRLSGPLSSTLSPVSQSLHAPIGFGLSWTPPDGVQFSSVTESDGSNTYTAELQPGHSGEVTKASVHVTADDVIDKITTDAVDGTRKLTDYDLSGAEPWSSRVIDYNVNGNMTDVTYYNHDQTKDVVTMDAAGAYIWASHQDH